MFKISLIVNTRNEENNIVKVLRSASFLVDEIIVVDMESDDQTVEIAKKIGAKVYSHKKVDFVEPARNYAIEKATGDWILILDADEEIKSDLARKLKEIAEKDLADYVRIPRKNIIFKKWIKHSRWWPDYNIRFFKKGYVEWSDEIHSIPLTKGRGADLPAEKDYAIIHHNYQTIEQFINRLNRYTSIQAREKAKKGEKFNASKLITAPMGEFTSRFFASQGYKDGLHGLVLALLNAFSELVLYSKLWQIEGFEKKKIDPDDLSQTISKAVSDLNYWKADMLYKRGGLLLYKIKRKFRLG